MQHCSSVKSKCAQSFAEMCSIPASKRLCSFGTMLCSCLIIKDSDFSLMYINLWFSTLVQVTLDLKGPQIFYISSSNRKDLRECRCTKEPKETAKATVWYWKSSSILQFPLKSSTTASVSSHLCFSPRKVSALCLFIYVNIDMCMYMHTVSSMF